MYDAFAVIKHVLPRDYTHINIYGMSDAHIGAKESSLATLRAWVRTVLDDPYGYVIVAGDMINNGIKDSKTNVYEEVMPPRQQKRVCAEIFKPLADAGRILAWIPGNHEERSARSVDDVNVQVIMEKFNGGGHLTTAAAQVDISPEEAIEKILEYMEEE